MVRRRGQAFTKYERQAILATFDLTQSLSETARAHHISPAGVLKLVRNRQDKTIEEPTEGVRLLAPVPKVKRVKKEPEKAATTSPAPALTLVDPRPLGIADDSPSRLPVQPRNPIPPTQSESKTRANSWELVGSIALASKAVLSLMHDELRTEQPGGPDGRALNEYASILQKLHISYGITVEKARLLHNESTGIIAKVEDLSRLPEGVTLDVAIAFVRGTIHGKLPA